MELKFFAKLFDNALIYIHKKVLWSNGATKQQLNSRLKKPGYSIKKTFRGWGYSLPARAAERGMEALFPGPQGQGGRIA